MLRRFYVAILLLVAGIQTASAQAIISTRTTGVTTTASSFPHGLDLPAGTPYELRIMAQFPSTLAPSSNSYYSTNAQVDVSFVIDGDRHIFVASSPGIHSFAYTPLHLNGVPQTVFTQTVTVSFPSLEESISFVNSISMPASELPADDVSDIFTLGSGSFLSATEQSTSIAFYDWNTSQFVGSFENSASTFEFSATMAAIPEPSMGLMLLGGLALFGSAARLRRLPA